ncbi:hypothetical protein BCV70DRAFT_201368 [Testicularia cyperi]|uniref:Sodium/calcium exchanger membrane region domain-containing protein n=1 Tax=Testicularia cyperi TaxID=1882483 RepID=A0A317XLH1_9BASI|nr:hypothetical protein BCV70DRAFT_201368 [Testicularia cyperi]
MISTRVAGRRRQDAWIIFAFLIVLQIICFRGANRLRSTALSRADGYESSPSRLETSPPPPQQQQQQHWKRDLLALTDLHSSQWHSPQHPDDEAKHISGNMKHHSSSSNRHHATTTNHAKHSSTSSTSSRTTTPSPTTASSTTATNKPTATPSDPDPQPSIECQPIPVEDAPAAVCRHVIQHCSATGHLDYLRYYYCAGVDDNELGHDPKEPDKGPPLHWHPGLSVLRLARLILILTWMIFLFSWVGVVASDFFCPNLSTIASRLGLNESTAGVTFLAFGNGSPDVFSTFGAMKTDSGTLAIGELIGAASFIVSVISGSMMLIAPFRVKPWPFCRDVGFFTVAVALTLTFLFDGKLRRSETIALICLYVLYASTVIVGSWWQERRRQQKLMIAAAREEYESETDGRSILSRTSVRSTHFDGDNTERSQLLSVPPTFSSQRLASPSEYDPEFDPFENWANERAASDTGAHVSRPVTPERTGSTGHHTPAQTPGSAGSRPAVRPTLTIRPNLVPRHSLLSAIEFRDVVQSLRRDASADRSQEIFQSWDPERFLPHHHHHATPQSASMQRNRSLMSRSVSRDQDGSPKQRLLGHSRVSSAGPGVAGASGLVHETGAGALSRDRRQTMGSQERPKDLLQSESDTAASLRASSPAGVDAGHVDDPWREHLPGDACEPLGSPAMPLGSSNTADPFVQEHETLRKSLPKLEIPKWDTKASRSEQRRELEAAAGGLRKSPSVPSIKVTPTDAAGRGRLVGLAAPPRIRPQRGAFQLLCWKVRVALHALFPSLRHLHAKSWLGVVVSFLTSPAILMLNLTLPVVDDNADEVDNDEADSIGALRLEGDEAEIQAHPDHDGASGERANAWNDADDDRNDDTIVDLGSATTQTSAWTPAERAEAAEQALREENTARDRDIASALRQLPQIGGSPLSLGSAHGSIRLPTSARDDENEEEAEFETPYSRAGSCTWEEEAEEQELHRSSRRFLILMQCIFAPAFVAWAVLSESGASHLMIKVSFAAAVGLAMSCLAFLTMRRKDSGKVRYSDRALAVSGMLRCSVGFVVSVMWIMTIVDEVVSILQTVGLIVGLSDAILGLTVFAVGNSLGDLVANVTIARLGHPVMAISACFAGPMLNLLLGVGISGTWLLSGPTSHQPWSHNNVDGIYPIDFSPTLLVSGLGLLLILIGTLIAVPMNNFHLTRPLGLTLIATYLVIMSFNLLTEIFWVKHRITSA